MSRSGVEKYRVCVVKTGSVPAKSGRMITLNVGSPSVGKRHFYQALKEKCPLSLSFYKKKTKSIKLKKKKLISMKSLNIYLEI